MERTEGLRIEPVTMILDVLSNWWVILLGAISAALITSVVVSSSYVPRYTTEATFAVIAKTNSNAINNLDAAYEMAQTMQSILKSNTMNKIISEELGDTEVDAEISANILGETNLLVLTVSAGTSKEAVEVINVIMNNYEKVSYFALGSSTLVVLEEPEVPTYPDNPLYVQGDMKTAFMYALVAMIALFAVMSYLHDTIKEEKDVEKKLDARCLGTIAFERKYKTLKEIIEHKKFALLINSPIAGFSFVEGYRKLATKVDYQMKKKNLKAIVVTSVSENEGKSTVAANLALSLAAQSKKVLLMEGDLRRPSQFLIFNKKPQDNEEVGEYLKGNLDIKDIVMESGTDNLSLVLGKNCYSSSTELLHCDRLGELIEALKETMDYIIIDSPPIGLLGDAEVLSQYAGAVMLVAKQNFMLAEDINDALDSLRSNDKKVLGVVLNGVFDFARFTGTEKLGKYGNYSRVKERD